MPKQQTLAQLQRRVTEGVNMRLASRAYAGDLMHDLSRREMRAIQRMVSSALTVDEMDFDAARDLADDETRAEQLGLRLSRAHAKCQWEEQDFVKAMDNL